MFEQYNPILITAALSSGILLYQPSLINGIIIGSITFLVIYNIINNLLKKYKLHNFLTIFSSSIISIMGVFYLISEGSSYIVAIGAIYLFLAIYLAWAGMEDIIDIKKKWSKF